MSPTDRIQQLLLEKPGLKAQQIAAELRLDPGLPPSDRLIKKLIRKTRQERGQLSLYIGYGLRLRPAPTRPDELRIEPALLYPIDDTPESPAEFLRPASTVPLFNLE